MDPVGVILLSALVGAIAIIAAVFSSIQAKKRREALAVFAAEIGFRFDPSKDTRHDDIYRHFAIFRKGHGRVATNTMWGNIEIDGRTYPIKMGDFRYKITSSNGKSSSTRTYNLSYLIAGLPFDAPGLLVRREHAFDKLTSFIGFNDIDFESAEFSRQFMVKGPDRRFAYDVIDPRMIEFLMSSDPPTIDIEDGSCLLFRRTRRWTPHRVQGRIMEWARAFFDRWPDHLTRSLDERSGVRS